MRFLMKNGGPMFAGKATSETAPAASAPPSAAKVSFVPKMGVKPSAVKAPSKTEVTITRTSPPPVAKPSPGPERSGRFMVSARKFMSGKLPSKQPEAPKKMGVQKPPAPAKPAPVPKPKTDYTKLKSPYKSLGHKDIDRWGGLASQVAKQEGLSADQAKALMATVATESSGNPESYRYEPGYEKRYVKGKPNYNQYYEKYGEGASASYGLGQVMYPTAVDLGYEGDPEGLYDPATSLSYAAKYIKRNQAATPEEIATLYNTGSKTGTPTEGHVDRFMGYYNSL